MEESYEIHFVLVMWGWGREEGWLRRRQAASHSLNTFDITLSHSLISLSLNTLLTVF